MATVYQLQSRKGVDNYRQLYVSYLTTSAIVSAIESCERVLIDNRRHMNQQTRQTWLTMQMDLERELEGRQLRLWDR